MLNGLKNRKAFIPHQKILWFCLKTKLQSLWCFRCGIAPRNTGKDDRRCGFTFIEILSAVVIMSAALIPVMAWIPTSITTKLLAEQKTKALFLAEGLIEKLRYQCRYSFATSRTAANVAFASPFSGFYYNVTDDGSASLKTFTVTVWHTDKPKNAVSLYTKIALR